jgi:hypothetical protein
MKQPEEPKTKTEGPTMNSVNGPRLCDPRPPLGGKRRGNKKGSRGRRKCLIRLNSAKEIQGFSWLLFGGALLDEAPIWLNFDLALNEPEEDYSVMLY